MTGFLVDIATTLAGQVKPVKTRMSDCPVHPTSDFGHLHVGIRLALTKRGQLAWRFPVLRIARIVMFALVPALALGAVATGCDDDTSAPPDIAMNKPVDMAKGDMAQHD
jgi:hypothetical protein